MKQFKLLILLLVIGFVAEAQINYLPMRSRYTWIAGKFDSTLHIPSGTTPGLRVGGHNGAAALFYRTSDSTVYVYTGNQWISVKGAGGSSDSTIFATLYRVDTAKTNIRTTLDTKIDSMRRVGLNVQAYKNGTWITQFTDSVGTGGGVSDTTAFIVDTLYNRLATVINADSIRLKSLRIQEGGVDITPTITDSTISWNITGGGSVTYADSLTVDTLINGAPIKAYGNSLTYMIDNITGYPYSLSQYAEKYVDRRAVSGFTSGSIVGLFNADAGKPSRKWGHIFEMGRNDVNSPGHLTAWNNIYSGLRQMVDTLTAYGNNKWAILSITNQGGEGIGNAVYDTIIAINNRLASLYPDHYIDVRSYLVSQYNPALPADVTNHSQDIPPLSLRVDSAHFNAAGYRKWAFFVDSVGYNMFNDRRATDEVLSANKVINLLSGQMPYIGAKTKYILGNTVFGYVPDAYKSKKTIYMGIDRELPLGDTSVGESVVISPNGYANYTKTARYNTGLGVNAMLSLTDGYQNTTVGWGAGYGITTGYGNAYFGTSTGANNSGTGNLNSAFGHQSLNSTTSGQYNTGVGALSMLQNQSGTFNFAGGYGSAASIVSASYVTATGASSLYYNTQSYNTGTGASTSYSNTSGSDIASFGFRSNYSNQTGSRISAFGSYANMSDLVSNYSVSDIVAFGSYSGYRNRGSRNIFIGPRAVQDTVTGSDNLVIGDSLELPDKTASYQMSIANIIYGKGTWGRGTSVGTAKIGIRNNAPSYNLDITGTLRATDSVRFSGVPTGTKAYFAMMDANGVLHRADTAGWGGSGGGGGGTTYKIGTYNTQTSSVNGAAIVGDSIYMQAFSAENPGLVPAGGSSTTYLRGDNTWQTVTAGAAGSNRQITFNSNGSSTGTDSLNWTASRLQTGNGTRVAVNNASVAGGATDAALMVRSIDNSTGGIAVYNNANYASQMRIGAALIQSSTTLQLSSIGGDVQLNGKVYAGGLSTATSTLQSAGSFATAYVAKSSSYTATISDCVIEVTATGQTITLPTAVGITGRQYTIKLTASGTGTVGTTSSQTIDGSTTYSLSAQYKYVTVQSNGANWNIIANN